MVSPEVTGTVEKGRAGFLVYLEFSKTFDSLSHTSFMTKLETNGFIKRMIRWVENWLDYQAQRVVTSGAKPSQKTLTSGVSQGSAGAAIVFNVFRNAASSGKVGTSCKSGGDTQPPGTGGTLISVHQIVPSRSRNYLLKGNREDALDCGSPLRQEYRQ